MGAAAGSGAGTAGLADDNPDNGPEAGGIAFKFGLSSDSDELAGEPYELFPP